MNDDIDPSPLGLLRCLQALADEAAAMRLTRTSEALQDAIAACAAESGFVKPGEPDCLPAWAVHQKRRSFA